MRFRNLRAGAGRHRAGGRHGPAAARGGPAAHLGGLPAHGAQPEGRAGAGLENQLGRFRQGRLRNVPSPERALLWATLTHRRVSYKAGLAKHAPAFQVPSALERRVDAGCARAASASKASARHGRWNTRLSGLARSRPPCSALGARSPQGQATRGGALHRRLVWRRQVEREWVGLRPGRPSVRLEAERVALPAGEGRPAGALSVVHCYGARPSPMPVGL